MSEIGFREIKKETTATKPMPSSTAGLAIKDSLHEDKQKISWVVESTLKYTGKDLSGKLLETKKKQQKTNTFFSPLYSYIYFFSAVSYFYLIYIFVCVFFSQCRFDG